MVDLTPREREVMEWYAAGKSGGEIATILGISEHNVTYYRKRVFDKVGACRVAQAVAVCIRRGLIA